MIKTKLLIKKLSLNFTRVDLLKVIRSNMVLVDVVKKNFNLEYFMIGSEMKLQVSALKVAFLVTYNCSIKMNFDWKGLQFYFVVVIEQKCSQKFSKPMHFLLKCNI
jgi:hypothetical protein